LPLHGSRLVLAVLTKLPGRPPLLNYPAPLHDQHTYAPDFVYPSSWHLSHTIEVRPILPDLSVCRTLSFNFSPSRVPVRSTVVSFVSARSRDSRLAQSIASPWSRRCPCVLPPALSFSPSSSACDLKPSARRGFSRPTPPTRRPFPFIYEKVCAVRGPGLSKVSRFC